MTASHCYHCQLPIRGEPRFYAELDGVRQPMCCPGCQAVTEAIVAGGLSGYYRHRQQPGSTARRAQPLATLQVYDRAEVQKDFVQPDDQGGRKASLLIDGISCAACIWLLEKHLSALPGVQAVHVNLASHEAQVSWDNRQIRLSAIMTAIADIGYQAQPWHADRQEALLQAENRRFIRRLAVAGVGAMQVMMYAIALYSGAISNDMDSTYRQLIRLVSMLVATPVVFFAAAPFFKAAWRDSLNRHPSMDLPVSLAIGGAYSASVWATFSGRGEVYFDSVCMFTFFLLSGRYLELRARHSTTRAARTLSRLIPDSCLKKVADRWQPMPVSTLQANDEVRVLPGDSIPADGLITAGQSSVNEAMLTGEFMPVRRRPGQPVLGGSLNIDQPLNIRITHSGQHTRIAAILALLRQAQQEKPAMARMADRLATGFVSLLLVTAALVYGYWFQHAPEDAFWITLSVLVVTCPCALSLATPTALTQATGHLHQLGFLVTRPHVLEGLNQINHVIFDKTGTLTRGALTRMETRLIDGNQTDHTRPHEATAAALVQLAAALEAHSEHPIASAFRTPYPATAAACEVSNHVGQGIAGCIHRCRYRLGRPEFSWPDARLSPPDARQWLLLASEQRPLCWFRLSDSLKPNARETLSRLMASGKTITLLSGDRAAVVAATAASLGITRWQAQASPDDKLAFIRQCQQQGDRVLMVGDGINDIPVLGGADISLAMAGTSDLARRSADALLLFETLSPLTDAFQLARKTRRVIGQNLAWALAYNLTALPLASAGLVTPWMAALGMTFSSLVVVTNALRLGPKAARQTLADTKQPLHSPLFGGLEH